MSLDLVAQIFTVIANNSHNECLVVDFILSLAAYIIIVIIINILLFGRWTMRTRKRGGRDKVKSVFGSDRPGFRSWSHAS